MGRFTHFLAALLGGEHVERRLRALDDLRADVDHARRVALVDLARGQRARLRRGGVARGGQRGLLDDGGGLGPVVAERHDGRAAGATEGHGGERHGDC
jgi:hypothetical protein